MEVEQPAEEAVDEEALLATVRQGLGARLGLREAAEQVGDVLAERADSPARRRLADDPWMPTEQLVTVRVEPWTILVSADGLPSDLLKRRRVGG